MTKVPLLIVFDLVMSFSSGTTRWGRRRPFFHLRSTTSMGKSRSGVPASTTVVIVSTTIQPHRCRRRRRQRSQRRQHRRFQSRSRRGSTKRPCYWRWVILHRDGNLECSEDVEIKVASGPADLGRLVHGPAKRVSLSLSLSLFLLYFSSP